MTGYDSNDSPTHDPDFPDVPVCLDCGKRLDDGKHGPGAFQCLRCAMGEFVGPDKVEDGCNCCKGDRDGFDADDAA